jgi:hypothetical protein
VVPFVACGDLSGFDADKSYPLQLTSVPANMTLLRKDATTPSSETATAGEQTSSAGVAYVYTYHEPVQPPIRPNYHSYQTQLGQQQTATHKVNKVTLDI